MKTIKIEKLVRTYNGANDHDDPDEWGVVEELEFCENVFGIFGTELIKHIVSYDYPYIYRIISKNDGVEGESRHVEFDNDIEIIKDNIETNILELIDENDN